MPQDPLHAVILAGGSGTRFWPLSRGGRPKQLLRLLDERTLLRATLDRLAGLVPPERVLVVTHEGLAAETARELPEVPRGNILAEPEGKDTAAAVGWAAVVLEARSPGAVMAVLPADHAIPDPAAFQAAIRAAAEAVAQSPGDLFTFGIRPTSPATGYGYIRRGEELARRGGRTFFRALAFREKPDRATAEEFLRSGEYYWNSGMFVWRASTIRAAFREHLPRHDRALTEIAAALGTGRQADAVRAAYRGLDKVPVDRGIMERASRVQVLEAGFVWDDVGTWAALARLLPAAEGGSRSRGALVCRDAGGLVAHAEGDAVIAAIGVRDLVIVHVPGATLVCPLDRAEEVKALVEDLRRRGLDRAL